MRFLFLITLTFLITHSSYADESKFPTCTSIFTDKQSTSTPEPLIVKAKKLTNSEGVAKLGSDGRLRLYKLESYEELRHSHYGSDHYEKFICEIQNVIDIRATVTKFIILTRDRRVIVWKPYLDDEPEIVPNLNNVIAIESNAGAFSALRSDGSVFISNDKDNIYTKHTSTTLNKLKGGVIKIFATDYAFCALKDDGTVVSWGNPQNGGDSSKVSDKLFDVETIYKNKAAFVALRKDGTAVSWGDKDYGGGYQVKNVKKIYVDEYAFIALTQDNQIVVIGDKTWARDLLNQVKRDLDN